MGEQQHTQKPWAVGSRSGIGIEIEAADGSLVAIAPLPKHIPEKGQPYQVWSDEVGANASLIAAAPELLWCCQRAEELATYTRLAAEYRETERRARGIHEKRDAGSMAAECEEVAGDILEQIHAAITKATTPEEPR